MSTFLYEIQAIVRDFLKTDPYFSDIHIVDDDAIDLHADTRKALTENFLAGELKGICIVIRMLEGTVSGSDVPGVFFMPATIGMEVIENPVINRAAGGNGKKCLVVAETLLAVVRGFNNSEIPNAKVWIAEGENPIRLDNPDWECTSYLCLIATQGGSTDTTSIVATPVVTTNAGITTMTCATSGASIYYTGDSSRPMYQGVGHAGNNGTLYVNPLAIVLATSGQARAFKTGLRASLIAPF